MPFVQEAFQNHIAVPTNAPSLLSVGGNFELDLYPIGVREQRSPFQHTEWHERWCLRFDRMGTVTVHRVSETLRGAEQPHSHAVRGNERMLSGAASMHTSMCHACGIA